MAISLTTLVLDSTTRSRIDLTNAPAPPTSFDSNVGKHARVVDGFFKDLDGIIFPKEDGVMYEGVYGEDAKGYALSPPKPYLIKFFYNTGEFFCATDVELTDLYIYDGASTVVPGSGTSADPYLCGDYDINSGSGKVELIHQLTTNQSGTVVIEYDFYGADDTMDVYFANDMTTKIAATGVASGAGSLSFYYDHNFDYSKIKIVMNEGITGSSWEYKVFCPV